MAPIARKFTLEASEMLQAARWVEKATGKDSQLFSIKIADSMLVIEAYNGIHSSKAAVSVDQKFDDETRFSVNARMFIESLKTIGSNTVQATFTERKLLLVAPKTRYNLPVTVPRNINALPEMPERFGSVDVKHFTHLLNHATSTASDDPSMPALTTVHFAVEPQNGFFKMMSTDRYRMVIRKVTYTPDNDASKENFTFDVDASALKALVSDMGEADILSLYAQAKDNSLFGVGTNNQRASVLQKDVTAINYAALMKSPVTNSVVINRKDLSASITKTKSALSGSVKIGKMVFDGDEMTLIANSEDIGTEMECELVSTELSEPLEISINLDYIGAMLKAGTSKNVKFGVNLAKPNTPVIVFELTDKDEQNPDYFSLFMPIRST